MPTYEYKCKDCGKIHTLIQKLDDAPLEICEDCGSPNVFKLVSRDVGVHYKCGGFYTTDNPRR